LGVPLVPCPEGGAEWWLASGSWQGHCALCPQTMGAREPVGAGSTMDGLVPESQGYKETTHPRTCSFLSFKLLVCSEGVQPQGCQHCTLGPHCTLSFPVCPGKPRMPLPSPMGPVGLTDPLNGSLGKYSLCLKGSGFSRLSGVPCVTRPVPGQRWVGVWLVTLSSASTGH
jgi:hypothetical protein